MSTPDQSAEEDRMDYEHLTHLLSDYESGTIATTEEDLTALRAEIAALEAKMGIASA